MSPLTPLMRLRRRINFSFLLRPNLIYTQVSPTRRKMSAVHASPQQPTTSPRPPNQAHFNPAQRPSRSRPSPSASPGSPRSSSPPRAASSTTDVEGVLRAHNGDVRRALDATLSERNSLVRPDRPYVSLTDQQAQNTQLWKLIEKQRAQTSHLVADNERLRSDRERANSRLASAGLEVVNGKRITNSSSALGLGLRPEIPQIKRHNSDQEDKPKPTLQIPEGEASSSTAGSAVGSSQGDLLPSPMPESKQRRESRIVLPSEVSSFMTLAESPIDATHTVVPSVPASSSGVTLSPTSQYSESPGQNGTEERVLTVPTSVGALAATTEVAGEKEETSPRPNVSLPPLRKSSLASVDTRTELLPSPSDELPRSTYDASTFRPSEDSTAPSAPSEGFQATQDIQKSSSRLPRLSPMLLPHARLTIPSSTVFPNAVGRDILCFIISVTVRPPNSQPASWNVSKLFSAFLDLDTKIKARSGKGRKEWKAMLTPLPEGRAWKDFAPSKIDQRKRALEAYLQSLLVAPIANKTDLCEFLSTDPVQVKVNAGKKEGYLTKKGKNFGGWKTRFFVLDGPVMEYYETVSCFCPKSPLTFSAAVPTSVPSVSQTPKLADKIDLPKPPTSETSDTPSSSSNQLGRGRPIDMSCARTVIWSGIAGLSSWYGMSIRNLRPRLPMWRAGGVYRGSRAGTWWSPLLNHFQRCLHQTANSRARHHLA